MSNTEVNSAITLALIDTESLLAKSLAFAKTVVESHEDVGILVQVMHMYNTVFSDAMYRRSPYVGSGVSGNTSNYYGGDNAAEEIK